MTTKDFKEQFVDSVGNDIDNLLNDIAAVMNRMDSIADSLGGFNGWSSFMMDNRATLDRMSSVIDQRYDEWQHKLLSRNINYPEVQVHTPSRTVNIINRTKEMLLG